MITILVTVIRLSDYFLKADHKYHMCGLCTTNTINRNSEKTIPNEKKLQKMYLNERIAGNDENDGGRKLLSFFYCPETCTHSNIAQCNLCDLNCRVCNNDECSQCNDGYFKKDRYTQCTNCQSVFGSECMFCQDFNGCGQCAQGYLRIQDASCGIWYCLDEYSVGLLDDFAEALQFGIDNLGLDDQYYYDYIDWAIDYDKLEAYPVDGSDNYAEIGGRYANFVDSSEIIEDGNTNFWSRVNTKPGLAQEALRVGIDTTNPIVYEHTEFSDYYEYELELLLGDDSDTSRRRLSHSCSSSDETYFDAGISNLPSLASNIPEQYAPPVTDQGGCGSCWAFGSTGQFDINYNRYIDADEMQNRAKFSEEYTIDCAEDCDGSDDNDCDGGTTNDIPSYFELDGHCPYWGYSFGGYRYGDSEDSCCGDCDPNCSVLPNGVVAVRGSGAASSSLNDFLAAVRVVDNGHAVQFRARVKKGDFLKNDVTTTFGDLEYWYGETCSSTLGGHAMVAVGQKRYVNLEEANNYHYYLKVRNSWGSDRHIDGYFWMSQSLVGTSCEPKDFQYNTFGDFPCTPAPQNTICIPDSSHVFGWVPHPETKCNGWRCKENGFNDNDDNCVTDNDGIDYTGLCPQCENGYFAFHESYKCQECPENCANCLNFIGCEACDTGYTVSTDVCSGVGYCEVTVFGPSR